MKLISTYFLTLLFTFIFTSSILAQNEYSHEETYAILPNGTFRLSTNDADITIKGTDRDDVYVKVWRSVKGKQWPDRDFSLDYDSDGSNVSITEGDSWSENRVSFSFYSSLEYTIDVEVPNAVFLGLEGDDDNYNIENINNSIQLDLGDGDVVLRSIHGEKLDIHLGDGEVYMEDVSGKLKLVLNDGDTKIRNGKLSVLDVQMDDGNFDLENITNVNELELRANDGDVDIKCELGYEADVDVNLEDGDLVFKIVDGGGKIEVDQEDGSVSYKEGLYELTSKTKYSKNLVTTKAGNSSIRISVEDGDVELK